MTDKSIPAGHTPPVRLYHISPLDQLDAILDQGLVPAIGPRSQALGEPHPLVYLFRSLEDVEQAMLTWVADAFDEDARLCVFELCIDPTWAQANLQREDHQFEWTSASTIQPCWISRVFNEDLKPLASPGLRTTPQWPKGPVASPRKVGGMRI